MHNMHAFHFSDQSLTVKHVIGMYLVVPNAILSQGGKQSGNTHNTLLVHSDLASQVSIYNVVGTLY